MKTIKYISLLILSLITSLALKAQSDSTLQKEVEVIKAYQPSISDAYKIGNNPKINDTITFSPTFEYKIYSNDIPVEKTINHLPVVQLGNPPKTKSNLGYIKGGFGNAWTPTADLFIGSTPSRNTDFGLQLHHFSSRPTILLNNELKVKSPYSDNLARIFVKNTFRKSILEWEVNYQRNSFQYYGFPEMDTIVYLSQNDSTTTLNARQAFNTAEAKIQLKNSNNRAKLDYKVGLNYDYFWNASGQKAHEGNYTGTFRRNYRDYDLQLDSKLSYFYQDSLTNNIDSTRNNHSFYHIELSPQYRLDKDVFQLYLGINAGTIIGADTSLLWNISPNIYFAYHPLEGMMTLFAGANGGFQPNAYRQTHMKNNYLDYAIEIKPSEKTIGFLGGLKGKLSRSLSYLFDVDYSINQNEAFYYMSKTITSIDTMVKNTFSVVYDDVNQLRLGGKLHYSSQAVTVDLGGNYYIYKAKTLTTLPHLPDFDIKLNTAIQLSPKIRATADATIVGPRNALYELIESSNTTSTTTTEIQTLKPILDLNLGLDYRFNKQLNFYLDARNVLNQNYEIWQGYNHQRMLIILGARYAF
ncbi:MAG: hypothetical protein ACERKD_11865 [Prolixibacteraceae bacterium]